MHNPKIEFIAKSPIETPKYKDAAELRWMVCPKCTSCVKYETIRHAVVLKEPEERHTQHHMSCMTGETTMLGQMFLSFSFAWLGHMVTGKNEVISPAAAI